MRLTIQLSDALALLPDGLGTLTSAPQCGRELAAVRERSFRSAAESAKSSSKGGYNLLRTSQEAASREGDG